jgi:hypothetical protein
MRRSAVEYVLDKVEGGENKVVTALGNKYVSNFKKLFGVPNVN